MQIPLEIKRMSEKIVSIEEMKAEKVGFEKMLKNVVKVAQIVRENF